MKESMKKNVRNNKANSKTHEIKWVPMMSTEMYNEISVYNENFIWKYLIVLGNWIWFEK